MSPDRTSRIHRVRVPVSACPDSGVVTTSNAVSVALERQGSRAGVASALMGTLQFASSALASALVGALADGTARPMSTVMLAGAAGAAVTVSLGRRTLGASSAGSSTVHAPSPTGEL